MTAGSSLLLVPLPGKNYLSTRQGFFVFVRAGVRGYSMPCQWGDHHWVDRYSSRRPGWIATHCVRCMKFLGRKPAEMGGTKDGTVACGGVWIEDNHPCKPAHHQEEQEDGRAPASTHREDIQDEHLRPRRDGERAVRGQVRTRRPSKLRGDGVD